MTAFAAEAGVETELAAPLEPEESRHATFRWFTQDGRYTIGADFRRPVEALRLAVTFVYWSLGVKGAEAIAAEWYPST